MTSQPSIAQVPAIEIAIQHHRDGRLSEAEDMYRQILTIHPDHFDALHLLGVMSYQAMCSNPECAEAHFYLARAFDTQGKRAEALAGYQEALVLKPEFAEAHFYLGAMLQAQGIIDEAIGCFQTALSLKPDYVEAH